MAKTVFDVLKERIETDIVSAKDFLAGGGAIQGNDWLDTGSRSWSVSHTRPLAQLYGK